MKKFILYSIITIISLLFCYFAFNTITTEHYKKGSISYSIKNKIHKYEYNFTFHNISLDDKVIITKTEEKEQELLVYYEIKPKHYGVIGGKMPPRGDYSIKIERKSYVKNVKFIEIKSKKTIN